MLTLASDFGSPYPAAMKGVLRSRGVADLVDVAHDLPQGDPRAAAFWLRFVLPEFPPGVHLVVVDPGVGTDRAAVCVRAGEHALVGPDNGCLLPPARALAAAADNGVVIRASAFPTADGPDLATHPVAASVTEIRRRTIRSPFFAVVDRTRANVAPTTRMPDPYGVVVNDDIISFVFQWYFQTCLWSVWETVSTHEPTPPYVCLEEFIRDIYPLWHEGALVSVTVEGIGTDSGKGRTVSGVVVDVVHSGRTTDDRRPTLAELSGQASVVVATGERACSVGGWGALLEDLEARRITVDGLELP